MDRRRFLCVAGGSVLGIGCGGSVPAPSVQIIPHDPAAKILDTSMRLGTLLLANVEYPPAQIVGAALLAGGFAGKLYLDSDHMAEIPKFELKVKNLGLSLGLEDVRVYVMLADERIEAVEVLKEAVDIVRNAVKGPQSDSIELMRGAEHKILKFATLIP